MQTLLSKSRAMLLCGFLALASTAGARASSPPPNLVGDVAAQPLVAQASRLVETLDYIGQPLPPTVEKRLAAAAKHAEDAEVSEDIQDILNPLCLGVVHIDSATNVTFHPSEVRPKLVEQGWRALLVKVVNDPGSTGALRADSPGARPLPQSPPEAVKERWIDVEMFDRRPMNPTLSGLKVEYRVLLLWAAESGKHEATLAFKLATPGGTPSRTDQVYRHIWNFDESTDGWRAENHSVLTSTAGMLRAESTGIDPFMTAEILMPPGEKTLRFRAKPPKDDVWQLFWGTEQNRQPNSARVATSQVVPLGDNFAEYEFSFTAEDHLVMIRLDHGRGPGVAEIDWIEITHNAPPDGEWARASMQFDVQKAYRVRVRIQDEPGLPRMAAFVIRDAEGRVYPMQSKRLEPDFFFQPQIYRASGEVIRLPAGTYTVESSRGPESVPHTQEITVGPGKNVIRYAVERWVDPLQYGYFSGDHHIHGAGCLHYTKPTEGVNPESMHRHTMGEDLKVGCSLNWGPGFDYQKQFFCGDVDEVSRYPYLIRQDVEVSGFGSEASGHLCLLRLREQIPPGGDSMHHWPRLCLNTLRWAKAQGAVCGTAHSSLGLEGSVGRVEGEDGPNGLPSYDIPRYDGIGANEFVVDITHQVPGPDGSPVPAIDFIATMNSERRLEWNMWYHVLNCGFRIPASGETDFPCMSGARVGMGRVYVKLDGPLEFDDWCEKLRDGRSYITDGTSHLMEFKATEVDNPANMAAVGERGSELKLASPGTVRLTALAAIRHPETNSVTLEVVRNGFPVATRTLVPDGRKNTISIEVPIEQSSWIALRTFPSAHSNPIYVVVDDKPVRASRRSAEWCRRGVDQCWSQKERFYTGQEREEALAAYQHARETYDRILGESQVD